MLRKINYENCPEKIKDIFRGNDDGQKIYKVCGKDKWVVVWADGDISVFINPHTTLTAVLVS